MASRYSVVVNSLARAQILALAKSSLYVERQGEMTTALRRVGQLLAHAPRSVGDPLYSIRARKLHVRSLTHGSLYVEYGVHESEPLVAIRFVASFRGQID